MFWKTNCLDGCACILDREGAGLESQAPLAMSMNGLVSVSNFYKRLRLVMNYCNYSRIATNDDR
ncbi:hypothetical protein E2C01_030725 [Portunus trituberculatus]|uniref:Uncharacterized protein n=1 Tax=Portunus trituberculatus TaxID=210409 RepID=A0A5B7ERK6_PORTR|nr:hypothetical protein [Portunus trituberculatus]